MAAERLAGYLAYKPGGTFSRLKSSRRQYCVLDEFRLLLFRCEEEYRGGRAPLDAVPLSDAAISLDPAGHQLVLHSQGKEHILTADSHRAMMTWALALQTKRDAWDKRVSLGQQSSANGTSSVEQRRRHSAVPDLGGLPRVDADRPHIDSISEEEDGSPETESASESDRLGGEDEEDAEPARLRLDDPVRGEEEEDEQGHDELVRVKCELAKCLNRERAMKAALEAKEVELRQRRAQAEAQERLQSQFLNDEIQRLSRMLQQEQFRNHSKQLHLSELRNEVEQLKRDYVFLLQSCIRLTGTDGPEIMELYMYGEKRHKQRVFALLEEARRTEPSLPSLDEGAAGRPLCHVDSLGFRHVFVERSLILHYVCRQLHAHYSRQMRVHERHRTAWRAYLRAHPSPPPLRLTETLKRLVRGGIPEALRSRVWSALSRSRIGDLREAKGTQYFADLCKAAHDSETLEQHRRQISLDLLRTLPGNVHFCERGAPGIQKMQDVLHAFCLHDPKLGYCQGMNFLVGMLLLFLDAEDAFWCLVAVVQRYFPEGYFDQRLIGAQADQEVLKELLHAKMPELAAHLAQLDIELSTVTLNWFLSLFIESVPLETLLRIWDCFLLEGPKVLFRFSLGILRLQQDAILSKHDTVSIMRQLKAAAKLCFDVDGLFAASFEELEPFARRDEIRERQAHFYALLLERHKKKERELVALRERERMMAQMELDGGARNHLIECAAVWGRDKAWVCYGHHHGSRVSVIHCQENIMYRLHIEFESRVMCMHAPNDDTMLFGTYSHFVHAYHTISRKRLWEVCVNACVLSLCSHQRDGVKQVLAGLADGTLAVVENVQGRLPKPEVFYVVIGGSPVTCVQLVGRRLWCASSASVHILSARTLDPLDQFQTSSNGLDYVYRMASGEQGVWITLRGSSVLQLWDPHTLTCRLLFDVRDSYSAKVDEAYTNHARVTSVLPLEGSVLVGTADGTLVVYDVAARRSPGPSAPVSPPRAPHDSAARQIQERLQKLLLEQQLLEEEEEEGSGAPSRRESSTSSSEVAEPPHRRTPFAPAPIAEEPALPQFDRFRAVDAGDLLHASSHHVVSALEFRGATPEGPTTVGKSASAEDIPTWVAGRERPRPVISAGGRVTFRYEDKSRLPSVKAFIRREARELASFLRSVGGPEEEEEEQQQQPREAVPAPRSIHPLFSIRPPTLDLGDTPPPVPDEKPAVEVQQGSSSSGVPPSFLSADEDFASAAQLNDLLQLQDWTRTSRKGSDTASNVSFGSTEVAFAFELHLKEKIKISDKPIRSLLQISCCEEPAIVSCAGYYGDDEAVLKWIREGEERLWTNDPIVEVCPFTHALKPSPYARSRLPRRASIATAPEPRSAVESGIARVQHLLSRVSERAA